MKPSWKKCLRISLVFLLVHSALVRTQEDGDQDPRGAPPDKATGGGRSTFALRKQHHQQQQASSPSLSSRSPRRLKRRKRAGFDGFRFSDLTRIFNNGAMNGVDTLLRSTRNLDVFQCLERISCEMTAPLRNDGSSLADPGVAADEVVAHDEEHAEDEAAEATPDAQPLLQPGGLQQAAQLLQPGLQQLAQFPQLMMPGFPFIPRPGVFPFIPQIAPTGFPMYIQPSFPFLPSPAQYLQYPQFLPTIPQLAQPGVQTAKPEEQSSDSHAPANGDHHAMHASASTTASHHGSAPTAHHRMIPAANHGSHPAMQHNGAAVNRNDNSHATQHFRHETPTLRWQERPIFSGYRNRINRRQRKRSWFRNLFRSMYGKNRRGKRSTNILKRHKRGIMDSLRQLWQGRNTEEASDQPSDQPSDQASDQATQGVGGGIGYSIYPYTRAALMGYTGTPETCEQLYPECPTTMDEMLNTFNNLRSYFPNGVPFRDRIPAPLRYLVP